MRAVLFGGDGKVAVHTVPDPRPGPGEVLVRTRSSAICGSDLHVYGKSRAELGEALLATVPGHELCGEVVEVGPGATGRQVGDRVIGYLKVGCRACEYCLRGYPTQCQTVRIIGTDLHGSDGEYVALPEWAAMPLPPEISYTEGAIISCNFSTAYSAVMKTSLARTPARADTTKVAVFGVGPVGLCAVQAAHTFGADVAAVDFSARRLDMAKRFGGTTTLNARTNDVPAALAEWTQGRGVDISIECSGTEGGRGQAMEVAAPLSEIVLVGNGADVQPAPLGQLKAREVTVRGSVVFQPSEFDAMIEFVTSNSLQLTDMVEHEFDISDAVQAFDLAASQDTGKILFRW